MVLTSPTVSLKQVNLFANQVFTTDGSFNVDEYFFEIDVPIVADVPFIQSLDFNAQVRVSDYSNFGEETVERFGLNWQIIDDVRLVRL